MNRPFMSRYRVAQTALSAVSQAASLRRFGFPGGLMVGGVPPTGSRRYGRLATCATLPAATGPVHGPNARLGSREGYP